MVEQSKIFVEKKSFSCVFFNPITWVCFEKIGSESCVVVEGEIATVDENTNDALQIFIVFNVDAQIYLNLPSFLSLPPSLPPFLR